MVLCCIWKLQHFGRYAHIICLYLWGHSCVYLCSVHIRASMNALQAVTYYFISVFLVFFFFKRKMSSIEHTVIWLQIVNQFFFFHLAKRWSPRNVSLKAESKEWNDWSITQNKMMNNVQITCKPFEYCAVFTLRKKERIQLVITINGKQQQYHFDISAWCSVCIKY